MAFAICAQQSAPGGFKQRSDLAIGRGDIKYLPIDRRGITNPDMDCIKLEIATFKFGDQKTGW